MNITQNNFKIYRGHHNAEFIGVEEREFQYGRCLLWKFRITHGYRQTIVTRITGVDPTKGACGSILSGLLDYPATEEDLHDINVLIGMPYSIFVQYHQGYPRVEGVQQ